MAKSSNILALDVGDKRVGMAFVGDNLSIPRSLPTITNDENLFSEIKSIIVSHTIDRIVVGLPRNLSGDETPQTGKVRKFAVSLQEKFNLPIDFQDEALTSVQAKITLNQSKKKFQKADVDGLAAQTILHDYLTEVES